MDHPMSEHEQINAASAQALPLAEAGAVKLVGRVWFANAYCQPEYQVLTAAAGEYPDEMQPPFNSK
jgi:hypothetical protein